MHEASTAIRLARILRGLVGASESESTPPAPTIAIRAPQEPMRICVPPGIPDAPPFAYPDGESGSDAQSDRAQA